MSTLMLSTLYKYDPVKPAILKTAAIGWVRAAAKLELGRISIDAASANYVVLVQLENYGGDSSHPIYRAGFVSQSAYEKAAPTPRSRSMIPDVQTEDAFWLYSSDIVGRKRMQDLSPIGKSVISKNELLELPQVEPLEHKGNHVWGIAIIKGEDGYPVRQQYTSIGGWQNIGTRGKHPGGVGN